MCVLAICREARPTPDMVDKMWKANPAGGGIAWRDNGLVKWEKGLTLDEIQQFVAEVALPFIAHFRIPSCGGSVNELTHPFPIEKNVSLELTGETPGYVLFHNGHWNSWKPDLKEAAKGSKFKLPTGKWSDTRAMAFMAHVYGLGILELIDEKIVAFGPADAPNDGIEVFTGRNPNDWKKVGAKGEEIWVSNDYWNTGSNFRGHGGHYFPGTDGWDDDSQVDLTRKMCHEQKCTQPKAADSNFCELHKPAKQKVVVRICAFGMCRNVALQGSDKCWEHKPKKYCQYGNCGIQVEGIDTYCERHRTIGNTKCKITSCLMSKAVGFEYCINHKDTKEESGGTSDAADTFRNSMQIEGGGQVKQDEVEAGQTRLRETLEGAEGSQEIEVEGETYPLIGEEEFNMLRWARSLNPKKLQLQLPPSSLVM